MARFNRLTDAEARQLTRAELLDRVEAEQKYWERKHARTDADRAAEREFSRIMHAYLSPLAAIQAVRDTLEGRRTDYWETRPGGEPASPRGDITLEGGLVIDEGQQAALRYGLREAAKVEAREREAPGRSHAAAGRPESGGRAVSALPDDGDAAWRAVDGADLAEGMTFRSGPYAYTVHHFSPSADGDDRRRTAWTCDPAGKLGAFAVYRGTAYPAKQVSDEGRCDR